MTHLLCAQQLHGQCGHQGPEGSGLLCKVTHLMRQRPVLNPLTSRRLSPKIQETGTVRRDQETQADDPPLGRGAPSSCPSPSVPVLGKTTTSDGNCVKGRTQLPTFQWLPVTDQRLNVSSQAHQGGPPSCLPPHILSHTYAVTHIHALSHAVTESHVTSHTLSLSHTFIHTQSHSQGHTHSVTRVVTHICLTFLLQPRAATVPASHTHCHSHTFSHTLTHTLSHTRSLTHSHPHSSDYSHTHSRTQSHILSQHHKFSVTQRHTITRSVTHTHTLSRCHTHTHSHTVARMFTCTRS